MKQTRLRQMVGDDKTYNLIIDTYKQYLKENKKKEFYYFRGIIVACVEAQNDAHRGWRTPQNLFEEFNTKEYIDRLIELIKGVDKNSKSWFERSMQDSITKTL